MSKAGGAGLSSNETPLLSNYYNDFSDGTEFTRTLARACLNAPETQDSTRAPAAAGCISKLAPRVGGRRRGAFQAPAAGSVNSEMPPAATTATLTQTRKKYLWWRSCSPKSLSEPYEHPTNCFPPHVPRRSAGGRCIGDANNPGAEASLGVSNPMKINKIPTISRRTFVDGVLPATNQENSPSRRQFLKSSAAFSLAAASSDLCLGAWAAGSDMIRGGLSGCGQRGTGAAINALDADPGARLVAIADLFGDKLQTSLAKIKTKHPDRGAVDADHCFVGFDGYKHVIESSDVVLIACASKFHPRYLKEAIDAGRHVFVEKPHGIDPVGVQVTQNACDLARSKGLCVVSGLHNRFDLGVRETIRRIHDGAIGEVVSMEVNFLRAPYVVVPRQPGWSEIEYQFRNWYHFSWLSGDDVTQSLVHSVDKAAWVMHEQPPLTAHGLGGRSVSFGEEFGDMFDHHAVVYAYENGPRLYAFCRTQAGCHAGVSDTVFGTKGRAELLHYRIVGETNVEIPAPTVSPYLQEQKELFAAIRAGKPINSGDYMAKSTMLAVLGQIACYTGRQLSWKKAVSSDFAFQPVDADFRSDPPIKPGPDGLYPVAVPGKTKLIKGT